MGLFIDRIREITGLVKVTSRLVVTLPSVVPGIAPADAFDAGDALGTVGKTDRDVDGNPLPDRGWIVGGKLIDPDDDTLAATVHIYSAPIPGTASDDALAHTAVDALGWITSMAFPVTTDIGTAKVAEVKDHNALFYSPSRTFWWQFSTAGTPNIAAGASPTVQFFIIPCNKP